MSTSDTALTRTEIERGAHALYADHVGISVASAGMHVIARANIFGASSQRAIVAEENAHCGLARMLQLLRDSAPEWIAVFRSRHAAYAWLGLAEPDA